MNLSNSELKHIIWYVQYNILHSISTLIFVFSCWVTAVYIKKVLAWITCYYVKYNLWYSTSEFHKTYTKVVLVLIVLSTTCSESLWSSY